jgi:hypothetical protein
MKNTGFALVALFLFGYAAVVQTQRPAAVESDESDASVLATETPWANGRLQVAPNGRFVQHENGTHFLYLADTPWAIFERLTREDVELYLKDTAARGFTVVQAVALWDLSRSGNAYRDSPIGLTNGRYDPAEIITTPGNDPSDAAAYDYWDHVDFVLDTAEKYGLYVALLPTWGNYVSGTTTYAFNMSSNIFTSANARAYGEFLGRRYGDRPNIIWVIGGDRSAVYPNGDFRHIWRRMAEGIGRGATGVSLAWNQEHRAWDQLLMTYHPRRVDHPGSSIWFHDDAWLDFNGIETEHYDVSAKVQRDWSMSPEKPTAVLEGRYEREPDVQRDTSADTFRQRYQLYHAMLSGSLGYAYGHRDIWRFSTAADESWRAALDDPGRRSMNIMRVLLEGIPNDQLLNRVPDNGLLDGDIGTARERDLLTAMRGGDGEFAVVYSTNGRDIRLNLAKLDTGVADVFWLSPRTGDLRAAGQVSTGVGAAIEEFDPPGTPAAGNDWVLKLVVRGRRPSAGEVVLHATSASLVGNDWSLVKDATAAGGVRLQERNDGTGKRTTAVADPNEFVEFSFRANAGTGYRLWIRGKGPDYASDSVFVQFSGSVSANGDAVYRIGTTDATMYSVVGCDSCSRSGWGWQDNGWNGLGPLIYFAEEGTHTLRLQRRQDGIAIDQIVLSPARYLRSAPGAERNDRTILPATQE